MQGENPASFTPCLPSGRTFEMPDDDSGEGKGRMVGLAIAVFIALFGWGGRYFGWSDPDGKVQLALAASFILGAMTGFKSKSD